MDFIPVNVPNSAPSGDYTLDDVRSFIEDAELSVHIAEYRRVGVLFENIHPLSQQLVLDNGQLFFLKPKYWPPAIRSQYHGLEPDPRVETWVAAFDREELDFLISPETQSVWTIVGKPPSIPSSVPGIVQPWLEGYSDKLVTTRGWFHVIRATFQTEEAWKIAILEYLLGTRDKSRARGTLIRYDGRPLSMDNEILLPDQVPEYTDPDFNEDQNSTSDFGRYYFTHFRATPKGCSRSAAWPVVSYTATLERKPGLRSPGEEIRRTQRTQPNSVHRFCSRCLLHP